MSSLSGYFILKGNEKKYHLTNGPTYPSFNNVFCLQRCGKFRRHACLVQLNNSPSYPRSHLTEICCTCKLCHMANTNRTCYFVKVKVALNKKKVIFFNLIILLFSLISVLNNQENEFKKFLRKFDLANLHEYVKEQQFLTDYKLISKSSSTCTDGTY